MTKSKLLYLLRKNEDSIMTINISHDEAEFIEQKTGVYSRKLDIGATTNFNNKYIKSLKKRKFNTNGNVLVFSWTENKFRIVNPKDVVKIDPLSSVLKNKRPETVRNGW